jgi:hypothetical protein
VVFVDALCQIEVVVDLSRIHQLSGCLRRKSQLAHRCSASVEEMTILAEEFYAFASLVASQEFFGLSLVSHA